MRKESYFTESEAAISKPSNAPLPTVPIVEPRYLVDACISNGPSAVALAVPPPLVERALAGKLIHSEISSAWYLGARPDVGMFDHMA